MCGGFFGVKVWHSTDKYRRVIYRCNKKYDGHKCQTPHVTEGEVKTAFVTWGVQQAGDGAGWRKRRVTLLRPH